MGKYEKILLITFLILLIGILFTLIVKINPEIQLNNSQNNLRFNSSISKTITTYNRVKINENVVIATKDYTGKIYKNSKIVAVSNDGKMYVVKNGVVLVGNLVISSNDSNEYSLYRIDSPAFSISTK